MDTKFSKRPDVWKAFIGPFKVLKARRLETFLWVVFVLVMGQLGTIISWIHRTIFEGWGALVAFIPETESGNFYTFSIVLMASLLGPTFIRLVNKNKPEFRSITIVFTTILIFFLILGAVFFCFSSIKHPYLEYKSMQNSSIDVDWAQLFFFVISIIFAIYSFGIPFLADDEELKKQLDEDYLEKENKKVNQLKKEVELNGSETSDNLRL